MYNFLYIRIISLFLKFTFILLIYKICYKSNNPICYAPIFAKLLFPFIKLDYLERSRISILYRSANLTWWSKFVGLQLRPITNSAVILWFTTSIATMLIYKEYYKSKNQSTICCKSQLLVLSVKPLVYDIPYIIESRCYLLYIGITNLLPLAIKISSFIFYIKL